MITIEYEKNKRDPLNNKLRNMLVMINGEKYVALDIRGVRKQEALIMGINYILKEIQK